MTPCVTPLGGRIQQRLWLEVATGLEPARGGDSLDGQVGPAAPA